MDHKINMVGECVNKNSWRAHQIKMQLFSVFSAECTIVMVMWVYRPLNR